MSARKPRQRTKKGVYKRCRRGFLGMTACPGYHLSKNGVEIRHARCGGDGWIKVGDKGGGRRRPRRKTGRVAGGIISMAAIYIGAVQVFGDTFGSILGVIGIVGWLAVKLLTATVRLVG